MEQRLLQLKCKMPVEPLKVRFKPSEEQLQQAFEFGVNFVNSIK